MATTYRWDGDQDDLRGSLDIQAGDSFSIDAFGRIRVSNPETIFDSKQLHDSLPLLYDDEEVSGSGTASNWSGPRASTSLIVANGTAGKRVRQTFRRFNYQPGKSLQILLTGVLGAGGPGITAGMGYYDDNDGIFLCSKDGGVQIVRRSSVSGSPVDEAVDQADWNIDKMYGNGPSGFTLDASKAQIFFIDIEWLGVGRVRCGFVINGLVCYTHQFLHANVIDSVYMSTPNLPIRYEIENDGTADSTFLEHICCSVVSEGGQNPNGVLNHYDGPQLSALGAGTEYIVAAGRLKATHLDTTIDVEGISFVATSANDKAHRELRGGGTPSGSLTFTGKDNSAMEIAPGNGTLTHSGGVVIDGGYFTDSSAATVAIKNALRLGAAIDGTRDVFYLIVKPITNNITIYGSVTWRELT